MNKLPIPCVLAFFSMLAVVPASAQTAPIPASMNANDSLYKAFGENAGLVKLMDDFMARLLTDARTKHFFEKVDQQHVKEKLTEQFCQLSGGPCVYKGVDMKNAHTNIDITKGNFNALVEVLQQAMDGQGIPFSAQNRMLALLAPMNREIITVK